MVYLKKDHFVFEDGQVCGSASQGRNTQTNEERRESLQTSYNWVSTGELLSSVNKHKLLHYRLKHWWYYTFIMFILEGSCDWGYPALQVDPGAARPEQGEYNERPDWAEQEDPIQGGAEVY